MSTAESSSEVFQFKDVHKSFGKNHVLRGLNIKVPQNKITFVIGRSGEGKSVTIKHLVGILKPDKGSISLFGETMDDADEERWKKMRLRVGLLFQDGALFDSITAGENVGFALREYGDLSEEDLSKEIHRLLGLVGLKDVADKFPSELSIGEKKRVGLARALALKPNLLLYDEPTTGMDPIVSELIDDLIRDMQQKLPNLSSVVISHDVKSMLTVAEHIVFLHEGKCYLEGPASVFIESEDPLIRQFLSGSAEGPLSNPIA